MPVPAFRDYTIAPRGQQVGAKHSSKRLGHPDGFCPAQEIRLVSRLRGMLGPYQLCRSIVNRRRDKFGVLSNTNEKSGLAPWHASIKSCRLIV
jgi:hypothetical protein